MRIYTKTGDRGDTALFGGARVPKDDLRVTAYGDVDELNAVLGVVRSVTTDEELDTLLGTIQDELFRLGAELALAPGKEAKLLSTPVDVASITRLEQAIDAADEELRPLTTFILPTGTRAAAQLHVARTVCRRAERTVVKLERESGGGVRLDLVVYLNRLSDLLFQWARLANQRAGRPETPWPTP
jgi:cob(I)alamin adenosyltransferase